MMVLLPSLFNIFALQISQLQIHAPKTHVEKEHKVTNVIHLHLVCFIRLYVEKSR